MGYALRPLALALLLNLAAAPAALADWTFVRVTGLVWVVKDGMEPIRAEVGMVLPDSATVGTTAKARAMLQQGEDILNVAPSTIIAPQARKIRGLDTVLMREGSLELDIEKLGRPHFAVETPFLAAVVKGTHFTVTVFKDSAEVSVARGRVGVTDFAAGERADVVAGQTARTGAAGLELSGAGTLSEIEKTATQTPAVETESVAATASAVGTSAATAATSTTSGVATTVGGATTGTTSVGSTVGSTVDTATSTTTSITNSAASTVSGTVGSTVRSVTANVTASFNRGTGSGTSNGNSASSHAGGNSGSAE